MKPLLVDEWLKKTDKISTFTIQQYSNACELEIEEDAMKWCRSVFRGDDSPCFFNLFQWHLIQSDLIHEDEGAIPLPGMPRRHQGGFTVTLK